MRTTISASFLLALTLTAGADMCITQVQTAQALRDGKENGAPQSKTSTVWFSGARMQSNADNESVIIGGASDTVYLIDHKKKTYTAVSLSQLAAASAEIANPEMQAMMGSMLTAKLTIEPTAETKMINSWNCSKYLQTFTIMGTTTATEMWASTDIKVDAAMVKKLSVSMLLKSAAMRDLAKQMQKESEKVKGFVVYSVTTTAAARIISEVREIKEAPAPAGCYEIPAKYRLQRGQ